MRAARLEERLAERELDALVVTNLVNVRYLTGYTGTNGVAVVVGGLRLFFTDFRYLTQAAEQVPDFEVIRGQRDLLGEVAEAVEGRVGFEDGVVSVRKHERLRSLADGHAELVAAGDLVEELRAVKEPGEVDAIRAAARLADEALTAVLERGLVGRTGARGGGRPRAHDARAAAPRARRSRRSSPTAPRGAAARRAARRADRLRRARDDRLGRRGRRLLLGLHAHVRDRRRRRGGGGRLRARALGAGEVGRGGARGAHGKEVDALGRAEIEAAGHGDHYGHGLGHGVGLEVHEGPNLSPRSKDTLVAGNVVTVEPGIYVPGRFGVRIEDLVVVTGDGCDVLSSLPKSLTVVS